LQDVRIGFGDFALRRDGFAVVAKCCVEGSGRGGLGWAGGCDDAGLGQCSGGGCAGESSFGFWLLVRGGGEAGEGGRRLTEYC